MTTQAADSRDKKRLEFFEGAAENWEAQNYTPEIIGQVRNLLLSLNLPAGKTILDVGCGRGVLIPILREIMGPAAKIIALDASAAMLEGAAAKDSEVKTIQARAEAIPLPDNHVDLLICFSAFPHIHDKPAAADEFYRVLTPGGTAYILHLCDREKINMHHDGHRAVHGDHLPNSETMKRMFTEAGFAETILSEGPERYFFSAKKE
ncbi:MAG: methyltransferase domain-containing protein [Candidatus Adiutrix sp.]|jgi:ubiquinone/menaquinone biosynthesis C-methylase UbiE|nr:methyltransferase domain-containing protein [Candidatus Adiutrix sp.]